MNKKPKIIVWDIENNWGFDADISSLLCIAYKELGSKTTSCVSIWDFPGWEKDIFDDSKLVKKMYEILSSADGFITHYGTGHDIPFFNSRCLYWGLSPLPTHISNIDTYYAAKYKLKLSRNRLGNIADFFDVAPKLHPGQKLWRDILNRDPKACKTMVKYCKQDVSTLEQVYYKLRPLLAKKVPNYNMDNQNVDKPKCPTCGSIHVQWQGHRITKAGSKLRKFQCQECGSWGQVSLKGKTTPM